LCNEATRLMRETREEEKKKKKRKVFFSFPRGLEVASSPFFSRSSSTSVDSPLRCARPILIPMSASAGDDITLRTNPETLSSWILTTQVRRRGLDWTLKRPTNNVDRFFFLEKIERSTAASHETKKAAAVFLAFSTLETSPRVYEKNPQQHLLAPSARGNLTILLNATCVACKFVQSAVRKVRKRKTCEREKRV